MANIRSFKELRVWQNAMDAAMRVFELTKGFPAEERYSLTDQFRRASRSVAANVAEAAECQTWTELALRCGYLAARDAEALDGDFDQILGQLVCMIDRPEDWIVGANRRRDTERGRRGDAEKVRSPRPPVAESPRPVPRVRTSRGNSHG